MKHVLTVCPYCGCGCNLFLEVEEGKVVGVSPSRSTVVSRGRLCSKGWMGWDFIHNADRLKKPLIKESGKFKEASWDKALTEITSNLTRIKEKYGPDSIAILSSAKCTNEENYLMMKFARAAIGTNNIDHCARLCHSPSVPALVKAFGSGASTNSMDELFNVEVFFIIGTNVSATQPLSASRLFRAVKEKGAKIVIADPRETEMAKLATLHLKIFPGTDVALLNALAKVIIDEGLEDKEFIKTRTEGYEVFRDSLKDYDVSEAAKGIGVSADDIRKLARLYAGSKHSAILYAMGITQHTCAVDNIMAIANLALLTGNVGREDCGVYALRGQNNVQGACDVGALPNFYTGYQKVDDDASRAKFSKAWGRELSKAPGLTVVEIFNSVSTGKIKALYIMGENPMVSDPDITHVEEALKRLEFFASQDIFPTETNAFANVILPASSFAEKDGTFTNTERRVQRVRKAIEPVGNAKADWQIICELATRMGYQMRYDSPAEIMDEIASLTLSYAGISYNRLDNGGIQWPCPTKEHPGTKYLHKDKFVRGLGAFNVIAYKKAQENPDKEYPFILTTGRVFTQYHTRTMTKRSQILEREVPEAFVELSPNDSKALGVKNNQKVEVTTRRGVISLKAKVKQEIRDGVIFIPFHYFESPANRLTIPALDPVAKIPEYKVCAARVEKA